MDLMLIALSINRLVRRVRSVVKKGGGLDEIEFDVVLAEKQKKKGEKRDMSN